MNRTQTIKVHARRKHLVILTLIACTFLAGCACQHDWRDATCTEPKICAKCGETEGDALGHNWGEWEVSIEATPTSDGLKERTCTLCGEKETDWYSVEALYENGHLLLSPTDFCERLTNKLYCQKAALKGSSDGEMAASITGVGGFDSAYEDGEPIAAIFFADEDAVMGTSEKDSCTIHVLTVKFYTDNEAKIAHTMMGIIEACDGSTDTTTAGEIGKKIVSAYQLGDVYHGDGIRYGLTKTSGAYIFMVTID